MEKRKIVFYLTIGMILILHLTACTNRSSELPAPDSTVFGYEGETKIIFDGVCAKYNDKKEKNQVFLPIVQVLGTYEEGNITKIVSCVSLTEMSLEEGNLTIATLLTPMAKNTQITLTARTNHTVSSISMSVKNPNGATTNLGTVTNTNSISKVYTPTVAAHPNDLYTVTVTAVSADGVTTSSTWTFRTY